MRALTAVAPLLLLLTLACDPRPDVEPSPPPQAEEAGPSAPLPDTTAARAAVTTFHRALAEGDSARVLGLLHPDALIYESGHPENVEEYRAGHLPADIAFAAAVEREVLRDHVRPIGDAVLYLAETRAEGTFRGRDVEALGVETMVLMPSDGEWRIVHVHWSSR